MVQEQQNFLLIKNMVYIRYLCSNGYNELSDGIVSFQYSSVFNYQSCFL